MELKQKIQTEEVRARITTLTSEFEHLIRDKAVYWRQRGKAEWMKGGDKNTSYFHARATVRKQVNKITGLQNGAGTWVRDKKGMEGLVDEYFRGLFRSSNPNDGDIEAMLHTVVPRLTMEDTDLLSQPFTEQEVKDAISSMSPLKSPGPDGYPALFYHKYWNILGSSVVSCILNFLNNHSLPADLNYTFIVLIPKVKKPKNMSEFRPISLCNVLFKIGSKEIANRLKLFLAKIISPVQSAFVSNRLITDNVVVAFEINHYIRTKARSKKDFMTLKLDISKAYDRVEWDFLRSILLRLGLPLAFVELIMLYVSSVTYAYLLNGFQFGHLVPERGLRDKGSFLHIFGYHFPLF